MNDYFTGAPLRLADGPNLLIDDALIEDRWRLRREVHRPEKHLRNPVLVQDRPWEGDYFNVPVVLWDPGYGKYRMWYGAIRNADHLHHDVRRKYVLYAESDDGIHWEKPLFDLHPHGRHTRTNILYQGTYAGDPKRYGAVCDQVFIDAQDPDPARRYKMLSYEARPAGDGFQRGVSLAVSADGLRWQLAQDQAILDYQSDTSNNCVFDPQRGLWMLYVRPRVTHASGLQPDEPTPGFHPAGRHHSRRVAVMTSRDLVAWSYPRVCLYPDERDPPDYDATSVFRVGSHFIMLYTAMNDDTDGTKDVRVASSIDGFRWTRVASREPFIARGREGDFDHGQVMRISPTAPVREGNRISIYYLGATRGQHDWHGSTGVGLVTTQADRFVMQAAGDEPGWLTTREFVLEGNRLRLNLYGRKSKNLLRYLKAEVLRTPPPSGHHGFRAPVPGFTLAESDPLRENSVEALVTWNGNPDLGSLRGQRIHLRFELRNMGLFSFQVTGE